MSDNYERERKRKAERSTRVRPNTVTPAWNFAEDQVRQGLRNIQFGIEGDGSLNRRRLLQDITLAGLPPEQEDILLKHASTQADEMVDRQFSDQEKVQSGAARIQAGVARGHQIGTYEREAEDREAAKLILPDITRQAHDIINSKDPLDVRFRKITSLQVSRPDMLQNKYYNDTFKTFTETLKNEHLVTQGRATINPELTRIEGMAKRMAEVGNVKGIQDLKEMRPDYGKVLDFYILEARGFKPKPSTDLTSRLKGYQEDIATALDADEDEFYAGITRKVRAVVAEAEKRKIDIPPDVKKTLGLKGDSPA